MATGADVRSATRFFVALVPPTEVQDYATRVIEELGDRYRTRTAKAPPHITLQPPFLWPMAAVRELEHCLDQFAQVQPKIAIELSGFGAFAPRVLYVNVVKTAGLLRLQAELMAELEQQLGIVDPVSKRRPFSPHVTVASRDMTRSIFQQAWLELQTRSVEFEFVSDRLTLLIHDGQRWQVKTNFPLALP